MPQSQQVHYHQNEKLKLPEKHESSYYFSVILSLNTDFIKGLLENVYVFVVQISVPCRLELLHG